MNLETKTAAELRELAAECQRQRAESWERSDTDGFLSQWASGLSAQLYHRQAEIVEQGGQAEFPGLFRQDTGERVPARVITVYNKFKHCQETRWAVFDPSTGRFTGEFYPTGANSRKQRAAGLVELQEWAPARAVITGTGRGLSGSAWVSVERKDGGCPPITVQLAAPVDQPAPRLIDSLVQWLRLNTTASYGVLTSSGTSKSGRDYQRVTFGLSGRWDAHLDVYGDNFMILRLSKQTRGDVYNSQNIWPTLKNLLAVS